MSKLPVSARTRTIVIFVLMLPVFLLNSIWLERSGFARHTDFSHYWQAGRMLLLGKNVYDSRDWHSERAQYGITSSGTESTFLYPLPMVALLMPFGALTIEQAYIFWVWLGEISILISMLVLISYYPRRSFVFELLAIGTVFLFRPTLYIVISGQVTAELLLMIVLSAHWFNKGKWFYGGLAASMLVLKPSLGIPFLILAGVWLLLTKHWMAVAGMITGGILLFVVGIIFDPSWVLRYLSIGGVAFDKYFGYQPTIWGAVGFIFEMGWLRVVAGIISTFSILAVTLFVILKRNLFDNPVRIIAILTTVTLLILPYAWNYELILLVVPILFILISISSTSGDLKAGLFSLVVLGLSIVLFFVALAQGYDVWSLLLTGIIWVIILLLPKPLDTGPIAE